MTCPHPGLRLPKPISTAPRHLVGASQANRLLAALPASDLQRLQEEFEPVSLRLGDILHEPGCRMDYIYFPETSLVSLLTVAEDDHALEVGLVGREGVVGVALVLGVDVSPMRALVQGGGTAMRMSSQRFSLELRKNRTFGRALDWYAHTLMMQVAQTAACNRFHMIEARLARWLLMIRDRKQSNELHMTHEFLAQMMGVRRVGVTKAAQALQQKNLIDYRRGNITITDAAGLEAAACRCYTMVNDLENQALESAGRGGRMAEKTVPARRTANAGTLSR
ncbi:MAG: Crp/Fnr family transcriptional regulator [Betaproteobacteria bacterium]